MSRERSGVSLYVNNIPYDIHQDEIRDLFDRYGHVRDVYMPRDYYTRRPRGFAYVEFDTKDECDDAIDALHRRRFHGRELVVEYAKGSRKTSSEMRGRDDEPPRRSSGYRRSRSPSPRRRRSRSRSPRRRSRSRSPRRRSRSPRRRSPSPKAGRRRSYDSRSPSPGKGRKSGSPSPRRAIGSASPEYRVKEESNGRGSP